MENGGNPSPYAASQLKGIKLGSSRYPVPMRGIIKAGIARRFIRSVTAPFTTTNTVVSNDNDETGTGGEGEDHGADDGTTGNSSAVSTETNNSPNGNGK